MNILAISHDGSTVAIDAAGQVDPTVLRNRRYLIIADARTGVKRHPIALANGLAGLALSPDAAKVAAVETSGSIDVFDSATSRVIRHAVVPTSAPKPEFAERARTSGVVHSAAISSDCSRAVVSCVGDGVVTVWDLNKGVEIRRFQVDREGNLASNVALSPDKRVIATVPWFGPESARTSSSIRLWDAESGRILKQNTLPDGNRTSSLAFTPNGQRLISGMADGTVLLWEVPKQ